jgi:hypothetical protein
MTAGPSPRFRLVRGPGAAQRGWRAEMSPRLRIFGEWQLGTPLIPAIVFLLRGDLGGVLMTAVLSFIFFLGLSYKFGRNRTAWWISVGLFSALWIIGAIAVVTTPT